MAGNEKKLPLKAVSEESPDDDSEVDIEQEILCRTQADADEQQEANVISLEERAAKNWSKRLIKSGGKNAAPKKIMINGVIALQHAPEWKGALKYDASALMVVLAKAPPWEKKKDTSWQERHWNDQDDRLFTCWLQKLHIDLSINLAAEAVQAVAREHSFHPIRNYLNGLKWDKKPRLKRWLITYLGAEDTRYHIEIGTRWLISGVARIYRPAIKADCMLILEGKQGSGKSTALKILGGDWFTDEVGELGSKDAAMAIAGRWIVEFGELEEFKGPSLERLKAFLSRTIDRFRPPYGRSVVDSPRQCIFSGTTNPEEYLHDSTGNRRFWPVRCGNLNIAALQQDRDQLWAEAKALFEAGEPWWLDTPELQELANTAQNERFMVDPWEEQAEAFLNASKKLDQVTISYLLENLWEMEPSAITRRDTIRVGAILRRLGWERFQFEEDGRQIRAFKKKI
jgi:predicted P-loop ATPase